MIKIKKVIGVALASILAISLIACQGKNSESASTDSKYKYGKLKIKALGGGACGAPAYIAFEKGFFADEGLEVELVSGTFDDNKTGLATGEFTVTNGDFQWFPSIQQGMDLKVIGGLHKGCIKIVVPPNSQIKTAKDLAGKNIGVDQIGGTPMSVATMLLSEIGIDPQTGVTWKPYPLDQLTQAVSKGEVDAFAAWDPYGTLAVNNGYTALTDISTDPLFAGKSCCFLYASEKKIKENPDRVEAIARAYDKACKWIKENPEETAKIEIEKKYVASDDLKLITQLIKSYDFEYTTEKAKDDVYYFAGKLNKTGFIKKDTDPTDFTSKVYYNILKK
jgi:NitT/TauT family transport system substrate-binding protein